MTVEEKRAKVGSYCRSKNCEECPLYHTRIGKDETECLNIANASESMLDEAIGYIEGTWDVENKPSNETPTNVEAEYLKAFGYETEPKNDPVNRPAHYTDGKIEVIEFIEDKNLGFCLGNAVKYIARAGKKDPTKEIEDLNKAKWYIERRIKELKEARS